MHSASAAKPTVSLIAALDRCSAIGRENQLPWRLADDLKRFKALTQGKAILMGRKTAQALGRALPGRHNLVLSRSSAVPFAEMKAVGSMEQALSVAGAGELMVIGGGEIYALALPLATTMYLTHVDTQVQDADTFFPTFDAGAWHISARESHPSDARNEYGFEFVDYRRR